MSSAIIPERLKAVKDVPLTRGGHSSEAAKEVPAAFCAMEKFAYITGYDRWTDSPGNCSQVIAAMLRRWNDGTDQAGRDALDEWIVKNADRLVLTANDGHDQKRGYLAADWAIRSALPVWLELAGATDAAANMRALAPVVDRASAQAARKLTSPLYSDMIARRDTALAGLKEKVRAAVEERLKEKGAAGAAWAAWAAWAAEAAEAAGAAEFRWKVYDAVYDKLRPLIAEKVKPIIEEKLGADNVQSLKTGAFDVLEQMLAVGETNSEQIAV